MASLPNNSNRYSNGRRDRWLLFAGIVGMVLLCAAVLVSMLFVTKKKTHAELVAPGFTLHDQQGRLTSLAQFRGRVVVLTFIDPECHQLCPLTTQSMVQALKILGPSATSHVQLLGIDANPLKTQVADVASYTHSHELQGEWRFLTGTLAQLQTIWRNYHVYVAVKNNDIEHTAVVFLIDARGNERGTYTTPMSYEAVGDQAQTLAAEIAQLLPNHPAVAVPQEAWPQSEESAKPIASMQLASLGSKSHEVQLGTERPHLVLFFAGWLGPAAQLSKDLNALDDYSAAARKNGWPSAVAVDELTTEPSPAEAKQALVPLAESLRVPVVEDASGRLADLYHIEDLPWFVLNSASGKILWSHDGWLPATDLTRDVHAALRANSPGEQKRAVDRRTAS